MFLHVCVDLQGRLNRFNDLCGNFVVQYNPSTHPAEPLMPICMLEYAGQISTAAALDMVDYNDQVIPRTKSQCMRAHTHTHTRTLIHTYYAFSIPFLLPVTPIPVLSCFHPHELLP